MTAAPVKVSTVADPPPSPPALAVVPLPPIVPPPEDIDEYAWQGLDSEDSGSDVANAEKGYRYTWLRAADHPPDGRQIHHERQKLVTRGFEPRSGPLYKGAMSAPEYVPNRPDLEIWRIPQKRWDNEWLVDMARQVLDRRYASRYYAHCEKGGQKGGLPKNVEEAMYAFHGIMQIPGRPVPPTREQLITLVRRIIPHPGNEKLSNSWD